MPSLPIAFTLGWLALSFSSSALGAQCGYLGDTYVCPDVNVSTSSAPPPAHETSPEEWQRLQEDRERRRHYREVRRLQRAEERRIVRLNREIRAAHAHERAGRRERELEHLRRALALDLNNPSIRLTVMHRLSVLGLERAREAVWRGDTSMIPMLQQVLEDIRALDGTDLARIPGFQTTAETYDELEWRVAQLVAQGGPAAPVPRGRSRRRTLEPPSPDPR